MIKYLYAWDALIQDWKFIHSAEIIKGNHDLHDEIRQRYREAGIATLVVTRRRGKGHVIRYDDIRRIPGKRFSSFLQSISKSAR